MEGLSQPMARCRIRKEIPIPTELHLIEAATLLEPQLLYHHHHHNANIATT
jgi:hypothetical protein